MIKDNCEFPKSEISVEVFLKTGIVSPVTQKKVYNNHEGVLALIIVLAQKHYISDCDLKIILNANQ